MTPGMRARLLDQLAVWLRCFASVWMTNLLARPEVALLHMRSRFQHQEMLSAPLMTTNGQKRLSAAPAGPGGVPVGCQQYRPEDVPGWYQRQFHSECHAAGTHPGKWHECVIRTCTGAQMSADSRVFRCRIKRT